MESLISELKSEYESNQVLSRMYFDKWIEQGEDVYKEKELLHCGAAHAFLRMIENILPNYTAEKRK